MPNLLVQVATLVVSGLALVGLAVVALLLVRRMPKAKTKDLIGEERPSLAIRSRGDPERGLDNVIARLTFGRSLDPNRFAKASRQAALRGLNEQLLSHAGDGVVLTVEGLRLLPGGMEMTVSASRKGQMLLRQGKAVIARHGQTGRKLAILRDARTGKFLEGMKEVRMAKALSRLGAMSSAVMGAAHILAGADIAKRLKQVEAKMDLLLAYRKIDQMATLERIYTSAKELGSGPMSREKCWELWRLRGELRELRCTWRREFQHHLSLIDDPKAASWFKRMFRRKKTSDRRIHGRISEGQLQLGLIEYSMRLDQVLAVGSQTVREFEGTLADEVHEFDAVRRLLKRKSQLISGRYPELSVEPVVQAMTAMTEQYKGLLPEQTAQSGEHGVLPAPASSGAPPDPKGGYDAHG